MNTDWTVLSASVLRPVVHTILRVARDEMVCICPDYVCFESTCDTLMAVWSKLIPSDKRDPWWKGDQ
jgi:hypothetical protein